MNIIGLAKAGIDPDDGVLLRRFAQQGDQMAFEELVRRHRALVRGISLRIMRDEHGAEDVGQVVFLMLAKESRGLSKRMCLAGWLHHTARLTALHARRTRSRQSKREESYTSQSDPAAQRNLAQHGEVLDAAIASLPEKYRLPILLHFMEDRSCKEIGEMLGCAPSVIYKRISRGLESLRKRLKHPGAVLTNAGMVSLLSQDTWAMAPSSAFVQSCSQAAMALATNRSCADMVGANVQTLMKGVLHMMYLKKLKMVVAAFVALAVLTGGVAIVAPGSANQIAAGSLPVPGSGYAQVYSIPAPYDNFLNPVINKYASPGDQITIYRRDSAFVWPGMPSLYKVDFDIHITNASGKAILIRGVFNYWKGTVRISVLDMANYPISWKTLESSTVNANF